MNINTNALWPVRSFTATTKPAYSAAEQLAAAQKSIVNGDVTKSSASNSGTSATGAAAGSTYDFTNMTPSQFMKAFTEAFHAGKVSEELYSAGLPIGAVKIDPNDTTSEEPTFNIFDTFQNAKAFAESRGDTKNVKYYSSLLEVVNRLQGIDRSKDIESVDIKA